MPEIKLAKSTLDKSFFLSDLIMVLLHRLNIQWRVLWRLDGHKSGLRARIEELL
jgi:hypothetical protein